MSGCYSFVLLYSVNQSLEAQSASEIFCMKPTKNNTLQDCDIIAINLFVKYIVMIFGVKVPLFPFQVSGCQMYPCSCVPSLIAT